ncbi:F-box only protein 9 [Exaiptasia diaphana]|uniref:F-box only protein 9 n=1 Tax=Exaiptasia diaphana TaxID=2652724 RepID=A0A913XXY1_EXADI|nr:F-box only protein 9 [Exaiptasia diaphana]KXJ29333.1 F-box only protein 9 [Exaiptasia diaphana]
MANQELQQELESFRLKWKEELTSNSDNSSNNQREKVERESCYPHGCQLSEAKYDVAETSTSQTADLGLGSSCLSSREDTGHDIEEEYFTIEEKAEKFYLKGVASEKNGFVYEAMLYYRKAVQLVPDIESRIKDFSVSSDEEEDDQEEHNEYNLQATIDNRVPEISALVDQFQTLALDGKHVCQKEFETRMTHISDIPVELLVYIFKWVVSTSLDFRSLEQLSMVCKGFYLCARDRELWRLGCVRIWGENCGLPTNWNNSWRWMFITKPHIWTQGVYISKTSYVRQGEQIQDLWSLHLVTYYRYIRFFNNGSVIVFTTPEEPQYIVPRLNQSGLSLRYGYYKVIGSKVVIDLDVDVKPIDSGNRGRKNRKVISQYLENKFHMELEIRSTGKRHPHNQLVWSCYYHRRTYRDTGETVVSNFDLRTQFPPFFYSRVRSYTKASHAPLK